MPLKIKRSLRYMSHVLLVIAHLSFYIASYDKRDVVVPVNSTEYLHIRYLVDRKIMPDGKLNLLHPNSKISRQKSALLAYNFIRHAIEDRGYSLRSNWLGVRPEYLDVHKIHFLYGRLNFFLITVFLLRQDGKNLSPSEIH